MVQHKGDHIIAVEWEIFKSAIQLSYSKNCIHQISMVVQCIVKMIARVHLWKLSLQKLMLKIAYPQKNE